jgi:hypothetical protein
MRFAVLAFALVLLFGGCFSKRSREIAALLPKPARFENEWLRLERHEPSLHYLRYLQFELDFKNLTDRALELKINGIKLVAPTNQSYSIFDEENALANAGGGFGFVAKSFKTGETIDTNSEKYIRSHFLKSTTIPAKETIRRMMAFPYPAELQGLQDTAFRGIYRIVIEGWMEGAGQLPFPELTWDADNFRTRSEELWKRVKASR